MTCKTNGRGGARVQVQASQGGRVVRVAALTRRSLDRHGGAHERRIADSGRTTTCRRDGCPGGCAAGRQACRRCRAARARIQTTRTTRHHAAAHAPWRRHARRRRAAGPRRWAPADRWRRRCRGSLVDSGISGTCVDDGDGAHSAAAGRCHGPATGPHDARQRDGCGLPGASRQRCHIQPGDGSAGRPPTRDDAGRAGRPADAAGVASAAEL